MLPGDDLSSLFGSQRTPTSAYQQQQQQQAMFQQHGPPADTLGAAPELHMPLNDAHVQQLMHIASLQQPQVALKQEPHGMGHPEHLLPDAFLGMPGQQMGQMQQQQQQPEHEFAVPAMRSLQSTSKRNRSLNGRNSSAAEAPPVTAMGRSLRHSESGWRCCALPDWLRALPHCCPLRVPSAAAASLSGRPRPPPRPAGHGRHQPRPRSGAASTEPDEHSQPQHCEEQQLMGSVVDHDELMHMLTSDSFNAQSMFEAQLHSSSTGVDMGSLMGQFAAPGHHQQQQQQFEAAEELVMPRRQALADTMGLSDSFRALRMSRRTSCAGLPGAALRHATLHCRRLPPAALRACLPAWPRPRPPTPAATPHHSSSAAAAAPAGLEDDEGEGGVPPGLRELKRQGSDSFRKELQLIQSPTKGDGGRSVDDILCGQ